VLFFLFFYFFCSSTSYPMEHSSLTDRFVQYNYRNTLTLKKDQLMQIDCVSTHLQMKQQVDSVRSVFKGSGIENLWKIKKGTQGNIASSIIEFVLNDGTSIKHPITSSPEYQEYFTTITKEFTLGIEDEKMINLFKDYRSTYQATDLKRSDIFKKGNIGDRINAYFDTEAQIVFYLFFKDLYREKLSTTLFHTRLESRQITLVGAIQELIAKTSTKDLRVVEGIQNIIKEALEKIKIAPLQLQQDIKNLNDAAETLKPENKRDEASRNTAWTRIENTLPRIRTTINKDKTLLYPLAAPDIIAVILHIHTELDPCEKCRHLLSNLSKQMNKHECDPQIFFKGAVSLPLPNAKFITIVSSSRPYSDNDARISLKPYDGGIINEDSSHSKEDSPNCIFMPIDHLAFSVSMLPLKDDLTLPKKSEEKEEEKEKEEEQQMPQDEDKGKKDTVSHQDKLLMKKLTGDNNNERNERIRAFVAFLEKNYGEDILEQRLPMGQHIKSRAAIEAIRKGKPPARNSLGDMIFSLIKKFEPELKGWNPPQKKK